MCQPMESFIIHSCRAQMTSTKCVVWCWKKSKWNAPSEALCLIRKSRDAPYRALQNNPWKQGWVLESGANQAGTYLTESHCRWLISATKPKTMHAHMIRAHRTASAIGKPYSQEFLFHAQLRFGGRDEHELALPNARAGNVILMGLLYCMWVLAVSCCPLFPLLCCGTVLAYFHPWFRVKYILQITIIFIILSIKCQKKWKNAHHNFREVKSSKNIVKNEKTFYFTCDRSNKSSRLSHLSVWLLLLLLVWKMTKQVDDQNSSTIIFLLIDWFMKSLQL